jgi:hypothetical protein
MNLGYSNHYYYYLGRNYSINIRDENPIIFIWGINNGREDRLH